MKRVFILGILSCLILTGCTTGQEHSKNDESSANVQTSYSEEDLSVDGNNIYVMSGITIDFDSIIKSQCGSNSEIIGDIVIDSCTIKDNIDTQQIQDDGDIIILRKSGRITSFNVDGHNLKIMQSDGKDEAIIRFSIKNEEELKEVSYTVIYDCHCE